MSRDVDLKEALDLFEALVELQDHEQGVELQRLRQDRPELAARVGRLLQRDLDGSLEPIVAPVATVPAGADVLRPPALSEGHRVGPFRILRLLGRGGMGAVYLAERADGVYQQRVAIKLVESSGRASATHLHQRFERERRILARLEHPGIARTLDAGETDDGVPYLVMEWVQGQRIDQFCDGRRLPVAERVELISQVCDAVASAHRALIIHRDLKPANILVTEAGQPKLLDFGIASLLEADPEEPTLTRFGARPMTPAYASPEQILGEELGTATDVYSLGAVLYELLCGRRPYSVQATTLAALLREVQQRTTPPPLSALARGTLETIESRHSDTRHSNTRHSDTRHSDTRHADTQYSDSWRPGVGSSGTSSPDAGSPDAHGLAPSIGDDAGKSADPGADFETIARNRGVSDPSRLRRSLRGDLERITAKALHADPTRRYASAGDLGTDLRRYLAGEPVSAQPDALGYRLRKFAGRHRAAVLASVVALLGLIVGLVAAIQQAQVARAERVVAQREARKANSTTDFLVSLLEAGDPSWYVDRESKGPQTTILEVVEEASRRLDQDLDTDPEQRALLHHILGNTLRTHAEKTLKASDAERSRHHFSEALRLRRQALGDLHPDTARSWYFLASIEKDPLLRLESLRESIAIERSLPEFSTNAPYAFADAADAATQVGQAAEAAEFLSELDGLLTRGDIAADHPLRLQLLVVSVRVDILEGDLDAATEKLILHRERVEGDERLLAFNAALSSRVARWQGNAEEALSWARREHALISSIREAGSGVLEVSLMLPVLLFEQGTLDDPEVVEWLEKTAPLATLVGRPAQLEWIGVVLLHRAAVLGESGVCRDLAPRFLEPLQRIEVGPTPVLGETLRAAAHCLAVDPRDPGQRTQAEEMATESEAVFRGTFGPRGVG